MCTSKNLLFDSDPGSVERGKEDLIWFDAKNYYNVIPYNTVLEEVITPTCCSDLILAVHNVISETAEREKENEFFNIF